jgi:hypothetical protein
VLGIRIRIDGEDVSIATYRYTPECLNIIREAFAGLIYTDEEYSTDYT